MTATFSNVDIIEDLESSFGGIKGKSQLGILFKRKVELETVAAAPLVLFSLFRLF